jgi:hypothetical protein
MVVVLRAKDRLCEDAAGGGEADVRVGDGLVHGESPSASIVRALGLIIGKFLEEK